MWAPDCIERNGKYYFYFPSAPKDGRGFGVGVAISDSPTGPFIPEAEPIKGINGIDPCVLQASDGNAYIFWGAGRCAKLKPNMKELADDTPKEKVKWGDREFEMMGVNCLKGLPSRQAEGPFAFEYNGNYYLTYPYVRENTEVLGYAMSKNPMGPYEYKGLIMAEHANGCWTNHHSIVNYKGQWYLFYHHNDFSPRDDKRRSVCIEKLYFNADGTIQEVKPTMRGVGINNATEKIEIDRYSAASNDVTTQLIDTVNTFRSYQATLPVKGSWIKYNDVNFDCLTEGYLIVNAKATDNTILYIREKTANGKIIAKIEMTVKPETPAGAPAMFRRDFSNQWLTLTAPLEYTPKGVTDLVVTCEAKLVSASTGYNSRTVLSTSHQLLLHQPSLMRKASSVVGCFWSLSTSQTAEIQYLPTHICVSTLACSTSRVSRLSYQKMVRRLRYHSSAKRFPPASDAASASLRSLPSQKLSTLIRLSHGMLSIART